MSQALNTAFASGLEHDGPEIIPYKVLSEALIGTQLLKLPLPNVREMRKNLARIKRFILPDDQGLLYVMRRIFPRRPGAFIDVGVNFGQSLIQCRIADPERDYVGFEPSVSCCRFVEKLVLINGLKRCVVLPVALGIRHGIQPLYSDDLFGDPSASLLPNHRPNGFHSTSRYVPVLSGDSIVESLSIREIALIKVDVEGAEAQVFKGFRRTIETRRPLLYFEALPAETEFALQGRNLALNARSIRARADLLTELQTLLSGLSYDFCEVSFDGKFIPTRTLQPNVRVGISNYLAVPRDDEAPPWSMRYAQN